MSPSTNSSSQKHDSFHLGFRICYKSWLQKFLLSCLCCGFIPVKRLIWNPDLTLKTKESNPCIWDYPPPCILLFCGKLGPQLFLWTVSTLKASLSLWDYSEKELLALKKPKNPHTKNRCGGKVLIEQSFKLR